MNLFSLWHLNDRGGWVWVGLGRGWWWRRWLYLFRFLFLLFLISFVLLGLILLFGCSFLCKALSFRFSESYSLCFISFPHDLDGLSDLCLLLPLTLLLLSQKLLTLLINLIVILNEILVEDSEECILIQWLREPIDAGSPKLYCSLSVFFVLVAVGD